MSVLKQWVCDLAKRVKTLESETAQLNITSMPLYEYRDIWAEEGSALSNNNSQWSFGNGAVGFIGLPIDDGWEVTDMYFHADTASATSDVTVHLVDMTTPSNAAPIISTVTVVDAGDGVANNAYVYETFATPVAVPAGAVLGFRTGTEVGAFSDARVGARLRREIGTYVSDVTLS